MDKATWHEAGQEILSQLDITAEYQRLGLRIPDTKAVPPNGWLPCHSIGREDNNPSAGINVSEGPQRGRYRDFGGGGESQGFFDFAAKYGPYSDWRAARAEFAAQVGVALPQGSDKRPDDSLRFYALTPGTALVWTQRKPGISVDAIFRVGGRGASYPAKLPPELAQQLIAFPSFGAALLNGEPTSWHSAAVSGKQVRIYAGKGKPEKLTKVKTNGPPGLMNVWALQHLPQATVVWVTEGLTDLLAMQTALGDRTDHVVVSAGSCSIRPREEWLPLFAGKDVRVCFDIDAPKAGEKLGAGQKGAAIWVAKLARQAAAVRNVVLPYDVVKGNKDLRDYYLEGHSYDDLWALSERIDPVPGDVTEGDCLADTIDDDIVANAVTIASEGEHTVIPLPAAAILNRLKKQTSDWPRRVSSTLFTDEKEGPMFIEKTADLFAFLHLKVGGVDWNRGPKCVTKDEMHAMLKQTAPAYGSIERLPHFPPVPGYYYSHPPIIAGDGSHLDRFLDCFKPASDIDRDLLQAAVMTEFWGGPPGARPAFLFISRAGRGVGKTKTAEMIANLAGGVFDFSRGEEVETMKKRLLTASARTKRVCMLDNIKTTRFSWAEFESLVTAAEISGHQMYAGERSRQNTLTWFMTLNGPALSRDIAQRVVAIELRRPDKYESTWLDDTLSIIRETSEAIFGDLAALFAEDPEPIERASRWASWERAILGRLPDPSEAQNIIAERQRELDSDTGEQEDIEDHFAAQLTRLGYDPDHQWIHIPNDIAKDWYNHATNERNSITKVTRAIKQAGGEGTLTMLSLNPCRTYGRGMLWKGKHTGSTENVQYDLTERCADRESRWWDR